MHLLFIDESGNPPPPDKAGLTHFVLGGVVIPEKIWPILASELKRIKAKYDVQGEIKWRYFVPSNTKPDNTLKHLPREQRDQLRFDLFHALALHKGVRIISTVANVAKAYADPTITNDIELYHRAYKAMTERFQYFLQDMERTSGQQINGLIVCDHRNSHEDDRLREMHQGLLNSQGIVASNYKNLIEGLFLAPSHHSVGIQYADLVAGAIFRKEAHNDTRFYDVIKPLIRTSDTGQVDGYGIILIPKGQR